MTRYQRFFLFIIFPVLLTSTGEFLLKHTINGHEAEPDKTFTVMERVIMTLTSLPSVTGLSCIIFGGILWLIAMSKYELSFLYPFLSVNFLIIILGSQILLGESVTLYRYVAVLFIIIGLIVISRSPYSEKEPDNVIS